MKILSLLFVSLIVVSCGGRTHNAGQKPVEPLPRVQSVSYTGADTRLTGVQINMNLDLLGTEVPVQDLIGSQFCNLSLGNTNPHPVTPNHAIVESIDGGRSGTVTFSHLNYYSAAGNDVTCRLFSNEKYNFTYDGLTLVLSAIAPGKAWDGAQSIFVK